MKRGLCLTLSMAVMAFASSAFATHDPPQDEPLEYDGSLSPGLPLKGTIGWAAPADGYDWYCFDVVSGQTVTIDANRLSGDIKLNLGILKGVGNDGDPRSSLIELDLTFNSTNPDVTLSYTPNFSGPVTIWVSTWFNENGGMYEVTMTGGVAGTNCAPVSSSLSCDAGGPYSSSCRSAPVNATVDDSSGGSVDYSWSTSDPLVSVVASSGNVPAGPGERPLPPSTTSLDPAVSPCGVNATLTLTVTNSTGMTASCSTQAKFDDQILPTLSGAPGNQSVSCESVPPPAAVSASDNCDTVPALSFQETRKDGACPDTYTLTRTWTATDLCGNSQSATQKVDVKDATLPTLVGLPADATVECGAVPDPAAVTATDNCDPAPAVSFSETRTDGSCPDSFTLTRTWTATDRCGNQTSASRTVVVKDTTLPTLTGVPGDATVDCNAVPTVPKVTASDNCDPAPALTFSETRTDGSCPDSYTLTRTWSATDRCGNKKTTSQTLVVKDTTLPTLTGVPGDATVECSAVPPAPKVTASDNCDPAPALTFSETRTDGSCPDSYTLTRTWSATDRCGNKKSASQTLTVKDTKAPTLQGVPAGATVECSAVPPPAKVGATDNCDPAPAVSFSEVRTDGSCPDNYTLTRTWTATDRCGNKTSASQILIVKDTTAPALIGVPADVTVECDAVPLPAAVGATDNCDPAPAVSFSEVRTDGTCPDDYTLTRTWTATDRCGNSSSAKQVVTVQDTTAPMVAGVLSPTVPLPPRSPHSICSPPASRQFLVNCSAGDNCDPAPQVSAVLRVSNHDVPVKNGPCVLRVEDVPVDCGALVDIHLVAPPCPAKPPRSPQPAAGVDSQGVLVVTGERVVLVVTATDRCGNTADDEWNPEEHPSQLCDEKLPDGTCCPPIAHPPARSCKVPPCPLPLRRPIPEVSKEDEEDPPIPGSTWTPVDPRPVRGGQPPVVPMSKPVIRTR